MAIRILNESLNMSTINAIDKFLNGVYIGGDYTRSYTHGFSVYLSLNTKNSSRNYFYLIYHEPGGNNVIGRFKSAEDAVNQLTDRDSKVSNGGYYSPSYLDDKYFAEFKSLANKIGSLSSIGSASDVVRDILENQLNIDDEELIEMTIEKVLKRKGQYVSKYNKYGQRLIANVDYIRDTAEQIQTGSRKS